MARSATAPTTPDSGEMQSALSYDFLRREGEKEPRLTVARRMQVVDPFDRFWIGFDARQIEIDHHRLLPATHEHAGQRRLVARVDLLMGDEGRHVDEIARASLGDEFKPVAPAHAGAAAHH